MKQINNGQLRIKDINKKVTLYGFVANKRKMGKIIFIDLRDRWGITQIIVNNDQVQNLTKESVIKIEGIVIERKNKNPLISTGEIEVKANKVEILSRAKIIPFQINDKINVNEDLKLKYRYLDLRNPKNFNNLYVRHKIIKSIRDFLDNEDFLEIETPFLSKSTPEGARDFLVPSRKRGKFFALPQSPQLYKQLLMASGIEKYFQVVRAFRDEDSRKDRQPEFTQLDIEMSYIEKKDIQNLIEKMLKNAFKSININIKIPFKRIDYDDAIIKYGTDKPDLRYKLELIDLKQNFKNISYKLLQNKTFIKGIIIDKIISKKEIKILEEIAKKNGATNLFWATKNENEEKGNLYKYAKQDISQLMKNNSSLIVISNNFKITCKSLGAIRIKLNEIFNFAKEEFNFVWIENWPLFEIDDFSNKISPLHHPFTQPEDKYSNNFDLNIKNSRAKSYDIVLNGFELGGGSIRISDIKTQEKMFKTLGLNDKQVKDQFGFFLEAFNYGLPPHGGIALGIDRLIMIINNCNSIREVIAFPKNAKGLGILEETPSFIENDKLKEIFIKINK